MRYHLTLHQAGLIANGLCDLPIQAAILLDYLFGFIARPQKLNKIKHEEDIYFWINLETAANDLPFIIDVALSPDSKVQKISRLMTILRKSGLIKTRKGNKGRLHFALTEIASNVLEAQHSNLADSRKMILRNSARSNGPGNIDEQYNNEQPSIVPKGNEISKGFQRARNLLNIRPTTPLDSAQARAWHSNAPCVEATNEDDWKALEWWFQQPSGHGEPGQFRRTKLATLLNHWNDEIIKARNAALRAGVRFQTSPQSARSEPPPEFCEAFIRRNYPDATPEAVARPFQFQMDDIQREITAAYRARLHSGGGETFSQVEQETHAQAA